MHRALAATAGVCLSLLGCSEADRLTDCAQVCDRYADCVDESYDVDACADRCDDMADESEAQDSQLDRCENCLDDRSCAESLFPCGVECAAFVP